MTDMTTCQGRWVAERQLPESDVRVLTCSDCQELWAIDYFKPTGRSLGTFPPKTPDRVILLAALEAR